MELIKSHRDLKVYKMAFETAQRIFKISCRFPLTEKYSLTDQLRRSSRSVAVNIAEAFRMRRYPLIFVSKLTISEGEAGESQSWIEFAEACEYIDNNTREELEYQYEQIISMLIKMIQQPNKWKV